MAKVTNKGRRIRQHANDAERAAVQLRARLRRLDRVATDTKRIAARLERSTRATDRALQDLAGELAKRNEMELSPIGAYAKALDQIDVLRAERDELVTRYSQLEKEYRQVHA